MRILVSFFLSFRQSINPPAEESLTKVNSNVNRTMLVINLLVKLFFILFLCLSCFYLRTKTLSQNSSAPISLLIFRRVYLSISALSTRLIGSWHPSIGCYYSPIIYFKLYFLTFIKSSQHHFKGFIFSTFN